MNAKTSSERRVVWLLCAAAAVHVLLYSAAFPFFNNVDEPYHFDLIVKYSHGRVPRKIEKISPEAAAYLAFFNTWEYFLLPETLPHGQFPPPLWVNPTKETRADFGNRYGLWLSFQNYESSQAPLYYTLLGSWWRAGQWLHLNGGRWLYGLRFLNILFVVSLVWIGHAAARMIFPDNPFVRLGVPALLAFIPQSAFYSIGNDTLSAVLFGLTFIGVLKWLSCENPSALIGAATGLAFAATYLEKATNLPLLTVVVVVVLVQSIRSFQRGKWVTIAAPAAFFLCLAPAVIGWAIWCKSNFGDSTGSKLNINFMGWTLKPFAQWWHHPIFSPSGFWTYLSGQLGTFWQGEFLWHHQPLALPGTEALYTIVSVGLLAFAVPGLFSPDINIFQRQALGLGLVCFLGALGFFALLSVIYDFHHAPNPSSAHPYFHEGRLLLGTLVPFLIVFVYGLDRALKRFGNRTKFSVLFVWIAFMLTCEVAADWPALFNEYNWFHLP